MLPPACRFTPTCSEYALEAFEKKGLFRAAWMTLVRIAKMSSVPSRRIRPCPLIPEDPWKPEDLYWHFHSR